MGGTPSGSAACASPPSRPTPPSARAGRTAWPCSGTSPRASACTPLTPGTSSTPSASALTALALRGDPELHQDLGPRDEDYRRRILPRVPARRQEGPDALLHLPGLVQGRPDPVRWVHRQQDPCVVRGPRLSAAP